MAKILVVYSIQDGTSVAMAEMIKSTAGFDDAEAFNSLKRFKSGNVDMLELTGLHIDAYYLDLYKADLIIFLSKHSSSKGMPSFTTHAEGNWSDKAELGGMPHQLSYSSPLSMLQLLTSMKGLNSTALDVTYEATHHGPLLKTPSLFVELGGNEEVMKNKDYLSIVVESVVKFINGESESDFSKIVVGIGSNHYPGKFTSIALGRRYAFAHIMSKYYVSEYEMLDQAFDRSVPKPESAVVDWKSISSEERDKIINKLNALGMDYERI